MIRLADGISLVMVILLVATAYYLFWGSSHGEGYAVVKVAGKEQQSVNLAHDDQLTIEGVIGRSLLEVRDGRIRFHTSPCQGQHCVHSGWVEKSGEVVACLPNQISVAIVGVDGYFDGINF